MRQLKSCNGWKIRRSRNYLVLREKTNERTTLNVKKSKSLKRRDTYENNCKRCWIV